MKKLLLVFFILILFGCSNNRVSYKDKLTIINEYPHDTESFTQGLFFYDNKLYESVGLYGKSKVIKNINIEDNTFEKDRKFDSSIFIEGSTIYNNKIYVLTWKENKVYVLDKDNLNTIEILNYDKEGWGLTTDGIFLIASDGSNKIYFMDERLNVKKTISIKGINKINELEYIEGYIWANIYKSNDIIIINPENGNIVKIINFDGLYNKSKDNESVLNGIAYNNNKIYITGKKYDTLYEFELKR